jgi:hypothetical protein
MALLNLIQRTRQANSLPLCADAELLMQLDTWASLLESVPDAMLEPAWIRATEQHEWTKPMPVGAVKSAAAQLILEDRERREKEAALNRYKAVSQGTYACKYCDDAGYFPLMLHCPTFKDWRRTAHPCQCNAAPINQRVSWPGTVNWERDRETGYWHPGTAQASPRCHCAFCRNAAG